MRDTLMSSSAALTLAQRATSSSRVIVTFFMTRSWCYKKFVSIFFRRSQPYSLARPRFRHLNMNDLVITPTHPGE
jgi:hypothetical protein